MRRCSKARDGSAPTTTMRAPAAITVGLPPGGGSTCARARAEAAVTAATATTAATVRCFRARLSRGRGVAGAPASGTRSPGRAPAARARARVPRSCAEPRQRLRLADGGLIAQLGRGGRQIRVERRQRTGRFATGEVQIAERQERQLRLGRVGEFALQLAVAAGGVVDLPRVPRFIGVAEQLRWRQPRGGGGCSGDRGPRHGRARRGYWRCGHGRIGRAVVGRGDSGRVDLGRRRGAATASAARGDGASLGRRRGRVRCPEPPRDLRPRAPDPGAGRAGCQHDERRGGPAADGEAGRRCAPVPPGVRLRGRKRADQRQLWQLRRRRPRHEPGRQRLVIGVDRRQRSERPRRPQRQAAELATRHVIVERAPLDVRQRARARRQQEIVGAGHGVHSSVSRRPARRRSCLTRARSSRLPWRSRLRTVSNGTAVIAAISATV